MSTSHNLSVAVIILNWNGKHWLEKFLPNVLEHTASYSNATIYVADNGSTDNSVLFLSEKFPDVKQLVLDKNYGFTGGYNRAIAKVSEDIIVLLNSDVEVSPNWIQPMVSLFEQDKNIAAAQPKILAYNEKTHFEYAGAGGGFIDILGYPLCRGRVFNHLENDTAQYNDIAEIFWATGACMFIRRADYIAAQGLDEDYFAHMEEIDLCWRLKHLGKKIMYNGTATVFHVGGGTLGKESPRKMFLNIRNSLLTILKNETFPKVFLIIWIRLVLDGIAALYFCYSDKTFIPIIAILKAHVSFYAHIPRFLKKRFQIQRNRSYSENGVLKTSVVFQHFVLGKKTFGELG